MSGLPCLQSSRRALYRVFVSPLERHEAVTRQLVPLVHGRSSRVQLPFAQSRLFAASSAQLKPRTPRLADDDAATNDDPDERGFDRRYTTKLDFEKSGRDRLPQDHEIKDPKIMVLDNGKFDGPLLSRNVMTRLSDTESLRMITPYIPARPKDNVPAQYAVCKIVNKREEFERQREVRERRRVAKLTSPKTKELEIGWGISDHDLQTKMKQLEGFLSKGMKVEVVLGQKKKGAKKADNDTAKETLDKVRKWIEDTGTKEYKPMDGAVARTSRIYLEGVRK